MDMTAKTVEANLEAIKTQPPVPTLKADSAKKKVDSSGDIMIVIK